MSKRKKKKVADVKPADEIVVDIPFPMGVYVQGGANRPPCPPGKHQAAKGERHCVWCGERVG